MKRYLILGLILAWALPFQLSAAGVPLIVQLKPGAPLEEMRVLTHNGEDLGGADAVIFLARQIWWAWPFYALAHIPGILIHGRLDLGSPLVTAWELAQAWPNSELVIVSGAGHAATDPGMSAALIAATNRFATRR